MSDKKLEACYKRIMNSTTDVEKPKHSCKVVKKSIGISIKKNKNAYANLGKQKVLVHRVVYEYINGKLDINKEISHLCGNHLCVKESHLIQETHSNNMSRIGCPGWFRIS